MIGFGALTRLRRAGAENIEAALLDAVNTGRFMADSAAIFGGWEKSSFSEVWPSGIKQKGQISSGQPLGQIRMLILISILEAEYISI